MKLEYHDLLKHGVQFFRVKAGYIPPKMDFAVDGFIPRVELIRVNNVHYHPNEMPNIEIECVYIELRANVCWDCLVPLRGFHPTIRVYTYWSSGQSCECCGEWANDDIPF